MTDFLSFLARWNHVEDLDSFFTRVYYYHQKHGLVCIVVQECFELLQFIFVVGFATFLLECVDYPKLFRYYIAQISFLLLCGML